MERFNSIYPFTTENIAGYMNDLDLSEKKIITVTGSSDHIINAILKGCDDITTFDVNPLTKYYMDLKLSAIKELSFEEFIRFLLYDTTELFNYNVITQLDMSDESKIFWIKKILEQNKDGQGLRNSELFNTKYFNPESKFYQNMYLNKNNFEIVKRRLEEVKIRFINRNLQELEIDEDYDYMFLSNISDYINMMFDEHGIENYKELMNKFISQVNLIYFAYLYDIGNINPRSDIDNIELVKKLFGKIEIKTFKSALEINDEKKDGVLILRRK